MRAAESQPQRLNGPSTDMNAMMGSFRQQANQMTQPSGGRMVGFDPMIQQQRAQEQEQLRQQGITPIDPNDRILAAGAINPFSDADMGKYNQISAERNMAEAAARANQPMAPQQAGSDAARLYEQFQSAQGMGKGRPGIDYPMVLPMPPQDNRPAQTQIPEGAQVSMARPQRLPNPYAQQVRQEDPRMQAMRMMQRMNFGGGGGYNF
jgi:hypothetical protein